jgi:hypothetical protein
MVASLTFRERPTVLGDNTIEGCDHAFEELKLATADWVSGYGAQLAVGRRDTRTRCQVAADGVTHECNVTRAVQDWYRGTRANIGFLLVGHSPALPPERQFGRGVLWDGNRQPRCVHTYGDFQLRIQVPPPPA